MARGISLTYGQATLNGKFLTAGKVQSSDGLTWFDLDNNEIAGNIKFVPAGGGALVAVSTVHTTANNAQATANNAQASANTANNSISNLTSQLKALAYADIVELASLGETVVVGGFLKTTLLDAAYIKSNIVNAAYIQTIDLNADKIVAGKLQSVNGLNYFDLANNTFKVGNATNYMDWSVTTPGVLTIKGHITADSGTISGVTINANDQFSLNGTKVTIIPNAGISSTGYMRIPTQAPANPQPGDIWLSEGATAGVPVGGSSTLSGNQDVSFSGLVGDQLLKYNGVTGKWENWTPNFTTDLSNYWTKGEADGRYLGINATAVNSVQWGGLSATAILSGPPEISGITSLIGQHSNGYAYRFTAGAVNSFLGINTGGTLNNSISGNAATATNWGGWTANFAGLGSAPTYLIGAEGGVVKAYSASQFNTALGGPFLPLPGGTLTGHLNGTTATFGNSQIGPFQSDSRYSRFGHSAYANTAGAYGFMQLADQGNVYVSGTKTYISSGTTIEMDKPLNGVSATFTSWINNPVYQVGGVDRLKQVSSYTAVCDPAGNYKILLGTAASYFDNTTVYFRTNAGANMLVVDQSTGTEVSGKLKATGGFRLYGGAYNTAYTPDGLWGATATPSKLEGTGNYSGFVLGYRDNGSGLYGAAYGFQVCHTDGAANNVTYNAIVMRDMEDGSEPFIVTNKGNITAASVTAPTFSGTATTAGRLLPLSGDSNYHLAYTADGARTNPGWWGRAVMYYVPNGQTYGIRVDRADLADNSDLLDGYDYTNFIGINGTAYYQANTWIAFTASHGLFWPNNPAGYTEPLQWYQRTAGTYGIFEANGRRNGYTGVYWANGGGVVSDMFDSAGNGGNYQHGDDWHFYWNQTQKCLSIGGSATTAGYKAQVNGALKATGTIYTPGYIISDTWFESYNGLHNRGGVGTDIAFGMYFNTESDKNYAIYRAPGAWSSPYVPLIMSFYTGIKIGASTAYGGTRFYNDTISNGGAELMSVGNGNDNVKISKGLVIPTTAPTNPEPGSIWLEG